MIYEVRTGKRIEDLNRCDYCSYNVGYLLRDKTKIRCDKFDKLVDNDRTKCKYNKFQNSEVE